MKELPKNAAGKIQKSALKPALSMRCLGHTVETTP